MRRGCASSYFFGPPCVPVVGRPSSSAPRSSPSSGIFVSGTPPPSSSACLRCADSPCGAGFSFFGSAIVHLRQARDAGALPTSAALGLARPDEAPLVQHLAEWRSLARGDDRGD